MWLKNTFNYNRNCLLIGVLESGYEIWMAEAVLIERFIYGCKRG